MQSTKQSLAKIEKLLAQVVGVQKVEMMTPGEFLQHASTELMKAQNEPLQKSRVRLSLLYKSVLYTSSIIEDTESESIKVPVFVVDQTTFAEQANEVSTPSQSAASNPTTGTIFEGGFLTKMVSQLQEQIGILSKLSGGSESPTPPKKKAGDDEDKEEPGVAKGELPDSAFLYVEPGGGRHFQFKNQDGAVDVARLESAVAQIAQSSLAADLKETLQAKAQRMVESNKRIGKGLRSEETAWPDDMNSAAFIDKGHEAEPDWGNDDRPL